jgi:succinate dehydrogenase/fumarate reductase flavoprotein subunit
MNEDCLSPVAGMNNYGQPGKAVFALWDAGYARHETVSGSWNNDSTIEGDAESIYQAVIASWDEAAAGAAAGSPPMVKGDTIEDVIAQLGLPSETADTVKRYNELASKGSDSDFYKNPTHLHAIESGPFYGQASGSYLVFLTVLGGLNTDANMRVCGDDDNPIPGLYNVGTMVGDMFATNYSFMIEGANYGANCITFGYLTGKYIAKNE